MNRTLSFLSIIVATAVLLLGAVLSAGADMTSTWAGDKPSIDGDLSDWKSRLVPLHNIDIRVAVCNDSNNLYIAAATADRMTQARILGAGLTYWFDRKGGNRTGAGLHSPVCNRNPALGRIRRSDALTDDLLAGETARSALTCEMVRNKGKERRIVYAGQMNALGVKSALSYKNGELFQEIRVPLSEVNCAGLRPGSAIGLGIMTCGETEPAAARAGNYSPPSHSQDMMDGSRGFQHSGLTLENGRQHVPGLEQWLSVTPALKPQQQ